VLVRLPNWLGDSLMARPLLLALRRGRPRAEITVVGPAGLLMLLAGDRAWDRAFPLPLAADAVRVLRAARFDTAFVLPPSFSSAWQAWRAGARERVGFSGDWRDALLTRAVRRGARGDLHLSREYLSLGEAAGVPAPETPLPALPVECEPFEPQSRLAAGAPYAVLAPGALYGPAKRWPLARFVELGRELSARGLRVIACGGEAEGADCAALAAATGGESLAGRTNLMQQAALCAGAAVVVSNDSGMAHLAGAVGAPTVAVFGSTSSAWTAPLGPRVRVVQRPTVCSPCFQRSCRIGYVCLENVGVRAVREAIEELGALRREGIA
jgi:heptosyltransferase-2